MRGVKDEADWSYEQINDVVLIFGAAHEAVRTLFCICHGPAGFREPTVTTMRFTPGGKLASN